MVDRQYTYHFVFTPRKFGVLEHVCGAYLTGARGMQTLASGLEEVQILLNHSLSTNWECGLVLDPKQGHLPRTTTVPHLPHTVHRAPNILRYWDDDHFVRTQKLPMGVPNHLSLVRECSEQESAAVVFLCTQLTLVLRDLLDRRDGAEGEERVCNSSWILVGRWKLIRLT